ncbi:MAG: glycoside hydrolase family 88 protein [Bacteroidota bacterium]
MFLLLLTIGSFALGKDKINAVPWSVRIAESFLSEHPDTIFAQPDERILKWNYDQAVIFEAMYRMWQATGNKKYFDCMQRNLDYFLDADGGIKTCKVTDYSLDLIAPGRQLLYLQKCTGEQKYRRAVDTLRKQLSMQPRTHEGGFWHKKIYPYQMWLDGLYMAEPFYAIYAAYDNEPKDFDDIAHQFIWMEEHARDSATGLLYHGWDESKEQRWANSASGTSPSFWGRAMGWYAMGLVDVLDYFPQDHPRRGELIAIFRRLADALLAFRDKDSKLWWQVVNRPDSAKNFPEASASAMFTYAFAKGANKGYLDKKFYTAAQESFEAIVEHFTTTDKNGHIEFHDVCGSVGLGGQPYRDGSYEYYVGVPRRTNDLRGIGAFLLAAVELEKGQVPGTLREGK